MKTCLYLDDVRTPSENLPNYEPWVIVRNYNEFVDYITTNGIPDFISFDHDLADEHTQDYYSQVRDYGFQTPSYDKFKEKTGLSCAMWLVQYCIDNNVVPKSCAVHSHNPIGAKNIQDCINSYKKHVGIPADCYIGRVPFKIIPK
jgi:hypothetical protein